MVIVESVVLRMLWTFSWLECCIVPGWSRWDAVGLLIIVYLLYWWFVSSIGSAIFWLISDLFVIMSWLSADLRLVLWTNISHLLLSRLIAHTHWIPFGRTARLQLGIACHLETLNHVILSQIRLQLLPLRVTCSGADFMHFAQPTHCLTLQIAWMNWICIVDAGI